VSLIVQPGDTRYLAPHTLASSYYHAEMTLARWLARPYFAWKMRPKKIAASEILAPPAVRDTGHGIRDAGKGTRD
jgi:hypothetical protein